MDENAGEPWTDAELAYLKEHWPTRISRHQIAARLGRTANAARQKAQRLGLSRPCRAWSESEIALLRERASLSNGELARVLSRPSAEISRARKRFGAKRLRELAAVIPCHHSERAP